MRVKPAPGLKVLDPRTKLYLPAEGKEVPDNTYWLRRLATGDVLLLAPAPKAVVPVVQIPDSSEPVQ